MFLKTEIIDVNKFIFTTNQVKQAIDLIKEKTEEKWKMFSITQIKPIITI